MSNETNKLEDLKVPFIGNISVDWPEAREGTLVKSPDYDKCIGYEKGIGDWLWNSGQYTPILDFLFPLESWFSKKNVYSVAYEQKIDAAPLIFKNFGTESVKPKNSDDNTGKARRSIWANLMLELGEFNLDHENAMYEKNLPYFYVSPGKENEQPQYSAIYARFDSNGGIIKKIWKRILGYDTVVVFIEDDPAFEALFELDCNTDKLELGKKYLVNTGNEYDEREVKKRISKLIDSFGKIGENDKEIKEKKKLVFIVDLLYKKGEINRIKGSDLIRYMRDKSRDRDTSLVIAFTGGKSPFIMNSAAKAGADAVIMKSRDSYDGHTHYRNEEIASNKIDSSGLFDLLWALSKNISRMRFLEAIPKIIPDHIAEEKFDYKPVLKDLFFSVEDESPFWKKYLTDWTKLIDKRLIQAVFGKKDASF